MNKAQIMANSILEATSAVPLATAKTTNVLNIARASAPLNTKRKNVLVMCDVVEAQKSAHNVGADFMSLVYNE